jgi:hypothetical protein
MSSDKRSLKEDSYYVFLCGDRRWYTLLGGMMVASLRLAAFCCGEGDADMCFLEARGL